MGCASSNGLWVLHLLKLRYLGNLLYHNHLQITINEPHLEHVMIDRLDVTRGSVLGRLLCDIMKRFLTTSGDRVQLACRSRRRRIFIGYSGSISA